MCEGMIYVGLSKACLVESCYVRDGILSVQDNTHLFMREGLIFKGGYFWEEEASSTWIGVS